MDSINVYEAQEWSQSRPRQMQQSYADARFDQTAMQVQLGKMVSLLGRQMVAIGRRLERPTIQLQESMG